MELQGHISPSCRLITKTSKGHSKSRLFQGHIECQRSRVLMRGGGMSTDSIFVQLLATTIEIWILEESSKTGVQLIG